ncbi:MAG: aminotransferase class I/II-fold pyridoxal phosphate-dependent enzyme [Bacteroidales bacterium]|nr:aminotransferase class I/II-fold pyridoxal phosphate-dependent enzyme [Bacteroidales bacterium]
MIIQPAERTKGVQEYYFSRKQKDLDAVSAERASKGLGPLINLGIGAPDGMPPQAAIDALAKTAALRDSHKYQNYKGLPVLRQAFADWYKRYYGVTLNPNGGIQPLVGSKEGILLISLAFVNPGDKVLVPDPGYPTYSSSAQLAGAEMVKYNLKAENGWFPDFDELENMDLNGVKLMWVNYPNMPTGASATPELYQKLVNFAKKHNILLVNDNPYSFILTEKPISMLAAEGAWDCCLELNSLSKAHNMSGWRLGMVAGDPEMVNEILKVKSQMDSGMFKAMQIAAVEALAQGPEWFEQLNAEYRRRRVAAGRIFEALGVKYNPNSTGLFLWGKVSRSLSEVEGPVVRQAHQPEMTIGEQLSEKILHGTGVFITPGFVFGKNGEDYVRISLCAPVPTLEEGLARIKEFLGTC